LKLLAKREKQQLFARERGDLARNDDREKPV